MSLTLDNINQNVVKAEYAVRGKIVQEAQSLEQKLKEKQSLPFEKIVYCNIGNPQQLTQKPITFLRHVQSIMASPELLDYQDEIVKLGVFKKETFERARSMLVSMNALPGTGNNSSTGAYTHSQGLPFIRENVCKFIEQRDNLKVKLETDRIFLSDGASSAVKYVLTVLIRPDQNDGVMIPIPQYPLYSATLSLCNGAPVRYYLDEDDNWSLKLSELERSYNESKDKTNIRALVVINPGNPTGNSLSYDNMKDVIQFCISHNLVLCADEVYQENVYESKFYSFNQVMYDLGLEDKLQLFSFHSTSKGYLGECGRRGGYLHVGKAVNKDVINQLYKMASINLCPNIHGQLTVDLMVNPPQGECKESYQQEKQAIISSLKKRAIMLSEQLNQLPGISCQRIQGAMYAFPRIELPDKAIKAAKEQNMSPDMWYALELLRATGVCCVPGSGFGQKDGTFHFRTTFLPQEQDLKDGVERIKQFQIKFMKEYSGN